MGFWIEAARSVLSTLRVGVDPDYMNVATDGTVTLSGEATAWDDFAVPLTPGRQGALSKPDYDYTELGLLFPQDDAAEIANMIFQMSHSKLMDSALHFHAHYIQSVTEQPTFKIDYRFYNNGEAVSGGWTTISTADGDKGLFDWSSGDILQIATFPAIAAPSSETVSANLDVKLYRDDNDVTGDVLAKYIDFHFQVDSFGSSEEYSK